MFTYISYLYKYELYNPNSPTKKLILLFNELHSTI